ncbi:tellurite resistance TerB family protein [Aerophototrophica crusticola]|uniref:Tellurite resistance TerB family protein n=1 Tax=Aerophototrophica crusticola TaxID=1709002 RepID=A0A858R921_9PROT|nr:tellurite resistance TerB family protein [Rhodospirillaceae bacterium B3]
MANLGGLLGAMMATGLGGRSARGPVFAAGTRTPGVGGDFRSTAGVAALGYLAYKAYQDYKANNPAGAGAGPGAHMNPQATSARGTGSSLGDRIGDMLSRGPAPQEPAMGVADQKALLLIRAMVAAANADGQIDADERARILDTVNQAGAGEEERRLLERELADPPSMDDIVAQARDPETAEQVYLASQMAITPDGRAEQSYLRYLADRLNLPDGRAEELRRIG